MPNEKEAVSLDAFDAESADRVAELIAAGGERLDLPKEDIQWGVRMLWTLGQVPAITDTAQAEAYARQLVDIMRKKIGRRSHERDVVAAFLRTNDGALAMALGCRIDEFNRGGARH
jgi:hypothetical protein